MATNRYLAPVLISALIGSVAAIITCILFFYFFYQPFQPVNAQLPVTATPAPTRTPLTEMPNPEITVSEVKSVSIRTIYTGYFRPGDKCAKTYNEYFGDDDGMYSSSSPCAITITVGRNGRAARSVVISRWDTTSKEKRVVEQSDATAAVTPGQFDSIAETIVSNQAFKAWREGTMIHTSNCSVVVEHSGGAKTVMSNVDEKTTAFLPMVEAFKKLEGELQWKKDSR